MDSNSAVPFPDLNGPAATTPKIVPKLEPLDEPPTPAPAPPHPALYFSDDSPSAAPPGFSPSRPDFSSEFHRISELFRSTVDRRLGEQASTSAAAPPAPAPEGDPDSRAIIPVPNSETQLSNPAPPTRKYPARSAELVRIEGLNPHEDRYFREIIRKIRMLFDSLRVFAIAEDERRTEPMRPHRRTRGDLRASACMRKRELWQFRNKRVVGHLPGVLIGDVFFFRMELCVVGLHGQPQAGIDYVPASQSQNGEPIATSIIVSGGYEDDEDAGDVIVYTGHGGQDKNNRQVLHQRLECGNLALERSMRYGIEIRVIRGFKYEGSISGKVYVYDGLYRIVQTWFDIGKSGFGVFKFKLSRISNQPEMGSTVMKFAQRLKSRPLELRPRGYLSLDLSNNKENYPIFIFNDLDSDQEPLHYDYITKTCFPPHVYSPGSTYGCTCLSSCTANCLCAVKNGGDFAYNLSGILVRGKPLVFECGPHCQCPPTCRNRVAQKGSRHRFEVFRSRETGWGLRSLDLILAGSFICEYAGVVLTREQAKVVTMNGDSLVYPARFAERWREWGDMSRVFVDYVCPSFPSAPPLDFAVDVSRMRNVACYISHSAVPNVFVQLVLYDHNNVCFPRLMVFALENIPPMRELSLDYGVLDESLGKLAICAA
ncbi:histone-lysine N-methyltransferase [Striga asiatica]|uniref:Histone-lysine N-methyltransferase n=1 Tax=Striga asiatica TaxID=4170 RepID=A0A5A7Q5H5_STRAF|nr:histone-lysine N-methyltransferase [Striga asiatica]